ncbi:MAG: ATP-binding protein [Alphaproteobacteria bacterium]|nr:ATP-binding protein [Alphaproteobacteria bacterium]
MLVRRMRLAAHDVRGVGMTLHGHADHLVAAGYTDAVGIASGAGDLLDLADDLQDLTIDTDSPRMLRDETVVLGAVVDEAIGAVCATILPGRRNWRIQPDLRPIRLRADRRALRHAITRILADAVRGTRNDDWIDVGGDHCGGGYSLFIADEGKGAATPEAVARRQDSRGISLRLALARALIEAHDGHLAVEAHAGVGSKVSLMFPAERVLAAGPPVSRPSHSYGGPATADGARDR